MIARCESYKDRVYRTAQLFIQHHSAQYLTDHSPLLKRTTEHLEKNLFAPKALAKQAVEQGFE